MRLNTTQFISQMSSIFRGLHVVPTCLHFSSSQQKPQHFFSYFPRWRTNSHQASALMALVSQKSAVFRCFSEVSKTTPFRSHINGTFSRYPEIRKIHPDPKLCPIPEFFWGSGIGFGQFFKTPTKIRPKHLYYTQSKDNPEKLVETFSKYNSLKTYCVALGLGLSESPRIARNLALSLSFLFLRQYAKHGCSRV